MRNDRFARVWRVLVIFVPLVVFAAVVLWLAGLDTSSSASGQRVASGSHAKQTPKSVTKSQKSKLSKAYTWYLGKTSKKVYASDKELAVLLRPGATLSDARRTQLLAAVGTGAHIAAHSSSFVLFVRVTGQALEQLSGVDRALASWPEVVAVSPVFFDDPRGIGTKRALTGQVIAMFRSTASVNVRKLAAANGLRVAGRVRAVPAAYLLAAPSALSSLARASRLARVRDVEYAVPNWFHTTATRAVPNDPLYTSQWHLKNTGQGGGTPGEDVNGMEAVWNTYKGTTSEVIAIVDDGLEIGHEDLSANTALGGHWDWVGNDSNPSPGSGDNHGTACGGVAAARGFNALGVTGAAPQARLIGYRLLGATTDSNEADALTRSSSVVDVSSNSWGPNDDRHLEEPGPLAEAALKTGATTGRGGKGLIYTWAGGNGLDSQDDSNFDGYANSRYTIAVAASTNEGTQPWYSETGANLLVNAPSDGGTLGVTTTDRTGSAGYAAGNYTSGFGGTSSATPLVAGVAGLMLQTNPNLTWRDVQHVLIQTAEKNDPTDPGWETNAAGYHVNHSYGFGRIDATAAVSVATTWAPVATEESASASTAPSTGIPDGDPAGVSSTVAIPADLRVEHVEVWFSASDHTFWDDLEVTLTSPSGTDSILAPHTELGGANGDSYNGWRFMTVRNWGESSQGNWTLTVKDLVAFDTGTFESWQIKVYGTSRQLAGAFAINEGASYATSATVSLDSTITNAVQMRFRDEGGLWSGWEAYAKHKVWSVPAGDGTKTVEAEFRNAALDVLPLSDSITLDTQAPTGGFAIDEGAALTATRTVSLDSTVTGADEMRFRNAGGTWSTWEGWAAHRAWTLAAGDDTKTVEAEFRDAAGNVLALSDSIVLETGAPDAPSSFSAARGDRRADLAWTNPGGDFAAVRILRSETGFASSHVPDAEHLQVYEGTDTTTTDNGLTNGIQYFYAAFARDVAGNWSVPATTTTTPAALTMLAATKAQSSYSYGAKATIAAVLASGSETLTVRDNVTLWRSADNASWSQDGTATWNATSERYEAARTITAKTYFQLRFSGEAAYASSVSGSVYVSSRAYLSRPWTYPRTIRRNRRFYVFGYLKPYHSGYTRLYIYRKVRGRWRSYTTRSARNYWYRGITRYRLSYYLRYPGYYYVRAYHWDGTHYRTLSPVRVFYVR